jgi:hypothetical protein
LAPSSARRVTVIGGVFIAGRRQLSNYQILRLSNVQL